MKITDNIEELFRSKLKDQKVNPDQKVWDNMQSSLENARLENVAKTKLSETAVKPSAKLWTKISHRLFWKQFLIFNPAGFNIFYLSAAILIAGGSFILLNNNDKNKVKNNTVEIIKTSTISLEETQKQKDETTESKATKNNAKKQDTKDKQLKTKNKPENNDNENNQKTAKKTSSKTALSKPLVENQRKKQDLTKMPSGIALIDVPACREIADNLLKYYPYNDTLAFDHKGEPITEKGFELEQGYYAGIIHLSHDITYLNDEINQSYAENKSYPELSYRFGTRLNYIKDKFMMQSGIYFASLNNKFEHNQVHYIIKDNNDYNITWNHNGDTIMHSSRHVYHNTFMYFELPLLAGFHLENNRFATNIKTGPIINFIAGANANMVLYSDNRIKSVDRSYFRTPGLRWEISADMIIKVNDKLSFYLEPAYVHDITNIFNNNYEIKSKFKGFSAGLGFYYSF